ncbi:MAG: TIM barrel protein [Verrucomicrobia bacterium]|nr:TIM barrel protein [Verrucomicrobiota bacterium]
MNTKINRRDFIKAGSVTVALAALCPNWLGAAPAKRDIKKAIMYGTIGFKGSVMEKFKAIKEAGFAGVEPMSHMNQDEVVKALEETGLKAASVCCNTHWGKPLSDPNPVVREEGLAGLKQSLHDAKRYGATSVLLVPGVVKDGVSYEDCWMRSIAEIRKAIPVAEETGVKVAIENVWNNFITKPDQAAAYLNEINSAHVGWHFDIGNVIKYSPPETWIPVIGKRILKLHVKEFSKTKGFGVKFFEGDNNWPAIMKALDDVGYKGWGISEQPGDQTKDSESLKEFSERMDKALAS